MKRCSLCKIDKSLSEFNKRARSYDGLQNVCKSCNSTRSKRYYAENREKHLSVINERTRKQRSEQRAIIVKLKEETPCTDCGINYPYYVMNFDHLEDKKYTLSLLAGKVSTRVLLDEIAKCEIVCANCHRIRTHTRAFS